MLLHYLTKHRNTEIASFHSNVVLLLCHIYVLLERCNPWPHVVNRQISISHPLDHYDVILIMASFVTELATPSVRDERTYVRIIISYHIIYILLKSI